MLTQVLLAVVAFPFGVLTQGGTSDHGYMILLLALGAVAVIGSLADGFATNAIRRLQTGTWGDIATKHRGRSLLWGMMCGFLAGPSAGQILSSWTT